MAWRLSRKQAELERPSFCHTRLEKATKMSSLGILISYDIDFGKVPAAFLKRNSV